MDELLDFCRVKKIDEKGFGFLKSLYFPCDIFFHFSQIKKEDFREKLQDMKRGDFFLFYTSILQKNGKRKAYKIWYSFDQVPAEMHAKFIERIIEEFETGKTNIFDLLFVFGEMKKLSFIPSELITQILSSKRIQHLPTTVLPYINSEELAELKKMLNIDDLKEKEPKPFWYDEIINAH